MGISTFPAPSTGGGVQFYVARFTSSGTWVAPAGLTVAEVLVVSAGGGGGGGYYSADATSHSVAGGGGGGALVEQVVPITGGSAYVITVGAGGAGGVTGTSQGIGSAGNGSSFGTIISLVGGGPGGGFSGSGAVNTDLGNVATFGGNSHADGAAVSTSARMGGGGGSIGVTITIPVTSNSQPPMALYGSRGKLEDTGNNTYSAVGYPGRNGFCHGGSGGVMYTTGQVIANFAQYNAGSGVAFNVTTNAFTGPGAATANFGCGGGGGLNQGTAYKINGSNGGSGYVEVRYWA